jgi:hypothetical protein
LHRRDAELHAEHELQQDRQPECRHREARDGHEPHRLVEQGVAIERRDDAERQPDQHRHDGRRDRELERCRQPLQQVIGDRALGIEADSHVARDHVGDVAHELLRQRLVEPEPLAHRLDLCRRGVLAGHHPRGIGRDDVRHHENDQRQPEQGRRHPCDALQRQYQQAHLVSDPALRHTPLIPAKAGIQRLAKNWVPAFAGTSGRKIHSH